jgi:Mechanosensitive ion channel, conserved TM helix
MIADVDLDAALEEAWENVVTFAPKLLGFFLILLIGFFIAKLLSKLTNSLLERVGFDGWVQRGALQTAFLRAKTDASDLIALIVFWAVFLITLQLAFGIWGPNPITDLIEGIIAYLPNVIAAVIILVIAAAIARVVTDVLTPALGAVRGGEWIARVAGIAILVVGIFAALDQLEIAPAIVNGLFYALLLVVAGSLLISFGVGGIPLARRYLERWGGRADQAVGEIRASGAMGMARASAEQVRDDVVGGTPPPPPSDTG